MALDGLEQELRNQLGTSHRLRNHRKIHLIRFADDFVITGRTKELLENKVQPVVERFLEERGLTLSATKTHITHISEGFDFLGQNIRKYNHKLLIRPSNSSVKTLLSKVRAVIKANPQAKAGHLIMQLNPIIRGWANYHRHVVSKKTFNKVDWLIYGKVWRWARRRHRKKNVTWVNQKYFKPYGNRKRVFTGEVRNNDGTIKQVRLYQAAKTPTIRHRKIKGAANPYDPEWELYFEKRHRWKMKESPRVKRQVIQLWLEQDGKCPICGETVTEDNEWDTHHIRHRVEGGKDTLDNLILLHPNCHRQVHSQGWRVSKPCSVKRALVGA